MWAATLLTSGAAAFGRLFLVQLLPSLTVVLSSFILLHANSFDSKGSPRTLKDLFNLGRAVDTPVLLLLILAAVLVAGITQSFQIAMIRLLEGYWGHSEFTMTMTEVAGRFERRRFDRLQKWKADQPSDHDLLQVSDRDTLRLMSVSKQQRLQRDLKRKQAAALTANTALTGYPPAVDTMLPTRLGNAHRAFEQRAGERYGYGTIEFWPRLYPYISDRIASSFQASVDTVDASVNFCYTFLFIAAETFVAFVDTPSWLWVSGAFLLLSFMAYRGAVAGASLQGLMEFVSFDLHRFEMLGAMHLALPADPNQEDRLAHALTSFIRHGNDPGDFKSYFTDAKYDHDGPAQ